MEPPAYSFSSPSIPTSARRSIQDTRELILANATIIKPREKYDGPIELVVGKVKPDVHASTSGSRSFTSVTSRITIRVNDNPEPSSSRSDSAAPAEDSRVDRPVGKHYAALVSRNSSIPEQIQLILLGEPQDTVEDALEWILDRYV